MHTHTTLASFQHCIGVAAALRLCCSMARGKASDIPEVKPELALPPLDVLYEDDHLAGKVRGHESQW